MKNDYSLKIELTLNMLYVRKYLIYLACCT